MARTLLADTDRAAILDRLGRLTGSSSAQWGSMQVGQMLRHTGEALRMALGDRAIPSVNKRIFRNPLVKWLVINVVPFPKEAPTAPDLVVREAVAFEPERERVISLVRRFESVPRTGLGAEHPLFGVLTWPEWGAVQHKHLDHHLRQFGV